MSRKGTTREPRTPKTKQNDGQTPTLCTGTLSIQVVGDVATYIWKFSKPMPDSKTAYKRASDDVKVMMTIMGAVDEAIGRCGEDAA